MVSHHQSKYAPETQSVGEKTTEQLESRESLLTENKLQERLRPCRADLRVILLEILTEPVPAMGDKLSSAIQTLFLPKQGEYVSKRE